MEANSEGQGSQRGQWAEADREASTRGIRHCGISLLLSVVKRDSLEMLQKNSRESQRWALKALKAGTKLHPDVGGVKSDYDTLPRSFHCLHRDVVGPELFTVDV